MLPHSLRPTSAYKLVWNKMSITENMAKLAVSGYVEEDQYLATAQATKRNLESTVSVNPDDVVLEIGCGVGRVGMVIAPLCKHWIGCDVSSNMLKHARKRLTSYTNVSFIEISGFDLKTSP